MQALWRKLGLLLQLMVVGNAAPISKGTSLVVVTGASSGIGKECARRLANMEGYAVILACRQVNALSWKAADEIVRTNPGAEVECCPLDLSSFSSVRDFSRTSIGGRSVAAIVHNAGVMACPCEITGDGHEITFQVNHLAPFLLTNLLMPNLKRCYRETGKPSRVIIVSSGAHRWGRAPNHSQLDEISLAAIEDQSLLWGGERMGRYSRWCAYANSKLYNVLYAAELDRRYGRKQGVMGMAVRPGMVRTGIARHSPTLGLFLHLFESLLTPVEEAAGAIVHAVTAPDVVAGGYYDLLKLKRPSSIAQDSSLQRTLWEASERMTESFLD
ncbi:unnamed protein product [Choristocarpus tenellus]